MLFSGGQFQEQDLTRDEIKRLFPNPWFALCAAGIPSFEAEKLQPGIAAYFDNCYVFSHNNWSVFLLNYSVRIGVKERALCCRDICREWRAGFLFFRRKKGYRIFSCHIRERCVILSYLFFRQKPLSENGSPSGFQSIRCSRLYVFLCLSIVLRIILMKSVIPIGISY